MSEYIQLNFLPKEMIITILLNLPAKELTYINQLNKYFDKLINNFFWRLKFNNDYEQLDSHITLWKEAYQNYGTIYVFGDNRHGELGLGDTKERKYPIKLSGIKVKFGACGEDYTILIDLNNNIWSCGRNYLGQLGLGDKEDRHTLTSISNIKAKFVACGQDHVMIIDLNDNIWGWGCNYSGQLGLGHTKKKLIPTFIGIKAKFISCSGDNSMIIDLKDNIWVCGSNTSGQLGLGIKIYNDKILTFTKINGIKGKLLFF